MNKKFLYVGHYVDLNGNYILKLGTTDNLERRKKEHTKNYQKAPYHTMRKDNSFEYDWTLELSPLNTLKYEQQNIEKWKEMEIGKYLRNDRFICNEKPKKVNIRIKKDYEVIL